MTAALSLLRRAIPLLSALACLGALAQEGPVRLVVPVPPGGSLDMTARVIAQRWQARGTPVVVDNRPGGNTLIGADAVAHSAADGRTLLLGATPLAIAPLQQKTAFNIDSLAPVIQLSTEGFALVARRGGGIDSLQDLAERAASRPAGINCIAVPGVPEIACDQLKLHLKGRSETIPYQGLAPATQALLGDHGDVMFSPMPTVIGLLRGGQVRLLAVSSRTGLPPGTEAVPLISEAWRGFVLEGFTGIFVPHDTPEERVRALNRELDALLRDPEVRAAMLANAQAPIGGEPRLLADQVRATQERYQDVVGAIRAARR